MNKSLIGVMLIFCSLQVEAGNSGGHGGDIYAYEFTWLAKNVLKNLGPAKELIALNVSYADLESIILKTQVYSQNRVFIRIAQGEMVEVDAANTSKSIKINRQRWRSMGLIERTLIAFHEYFGVLAIEWDHYNVSHPLRKALLAALDRALADKTVVAPHIFYGLADVVPPLTALDFCSPNGLAYEKARREAMEMAVNHCKTQFVTCDIYDLTVVTTFDERNPALQYCSADVAVLGK